MDSSELKRGSRRPPLQRAAKAVRRGAAEGSSPAYLVRWTRGHEDLYRELEDEARRLRVIDVDPLEKPALKPSVGDATEPKSIVRRGLDDARVTKTEGQRVIVLRTRDAEAGKKSKRRRRRRRGRGRGANDPPA